MKLKTLATALTLSLPLAFGGAYAQTTTTGESGNNRSADGGAYTTNPNPQPGTAAAPGTDSPGAQGASGSATAADATGASGTSGTDGTATPGTAGAQPGAANALDKMTPNAKMDTTGATAPGMETQRSAAANSTEAITGWSAKDDLIGKSVFNENDEKVGDIEDVVISSDGETLYLLVGAGGFLGMGSKNVAVPFERFDRRDDRILLSGYTKDQLKALPEVRTER